MTHLIDYDRTNDMNSQMDGLMSIEYQINNEIDNRVT